METTPSRAKARVVIELQPDGTLRVEHYVNGARSVENLERGFEMQVIREILAQADARAEREYRAAIAAKEAAQLALHRRVWRNLATDPHYGTQFANKVVGTDVPYRGKKSAEREARVPGAVYATPDMF